MSYYGKEMIKMTVKQKFWTIVGRFLYKIGYLKDGES